MKKEITELQHHMRSLGLDWYIVPTTDYHGSEYVPPHFRFREFLSGFTGSYGTLLIGLESAHLWTDGRYFLQAEAQLSGSQITLMKIGVPEVPGLSRFLEENISSNQTLGFDGRLMSIEGGEIFESICKRTGASLISDVDLAERVWKNRPKLVPSPIYRLPIEVTGKTSDEKISDVRAEMAAKGAGVLILTNLEEIAWLFNLRGSDIKHTPVFYAFALIEKSHCTLFTSKDMLPQDFPTDKVKNYHDIYKDLSAISPCEKVWISKTQGSFSIFKGLRKFTEAADDSAASDGGRPCEGRKSASGSKFIFDPTPISLMKAAKNQIEIKATKTAHLKDGIAMVNFLFWIKRNIGKVPISELSASEVLEEYRKKQDGYMEPSFTTISGYGANGAIIHYTPTADSNKTLSPHGFLLLDSGGQYCCGTTDITRTIALGPLTGKMKKYYTAVLKAHISLASSEFPKGTAGASLDAPTRLPLKALGLNYNHGTGHGVGHMLSVHEGPQNISPRGTAQPLVPGMITSNEPGVYIPNEFGIRLENEILCTEKKNGMLKFETITLCPFDSDAILPEELTKKEKKWLNDYHETVNFLLSPYLDEDAAAWLKTATSEI
ncbi:MAG: aminopeptidase P family protein [Hornefia sp.]|nr:aminopeptidase P family protein [Hornefia sp.]